MKTLKELCPAPAEIRKYYNMELEEDDLIIIEEHFAHCTKCLKTYAHYEEFIDQITLSASVQKDLWLNSNADSFNVAVAEGYNDTLTSEIKSKDGKYILKLIPYLDESHKALLVIELTDVSIQGSLRVDLLDCTSPVLIGVQPISNESQVCFEVQYDINLRNIIITIV